jgi:hypothetical protein
VTTARMRARFFAAMGVAAAACSKDRPSSSSTAATAATAETATAPVTASLPKYRIPMCPHGAFCEAQPKTIAADAGAPDPYGKCAAVIAMPGGDAGFFQGRQRVTFDPAGTKAKRASDPNACCYTWVVPCPGGRPLRDDDGRPIVASAARRDDWIDAAAVTVARSLSPEAREALADRWAREAGFEHASIASFARATLDLLALGAPSELVAGAQRAALDEVEHARIAYALASALAGRPVGPGPLAVDHATRPPTLRAVVRDAVAEGCIGETLAALSLREEARASAEPMRSLLGRIADDEERHAELAYATVAWAASVDYDTTADVIEEELDRAREGATERVVREIATPCFAALISSVAAERPV